MPYHLAPLTFLMPATLFSVAAMYSILGLYGWFKRASPAAKAFSWLMLALGLWSLGYGLEVAAPLPEQKLFWAKFEYPAIAAGPVLWLFFALEYVGSSALVARHHRRFLWIVPALVVALFWTNDYHHLIWKSVVLVQERGLSLLDPSYGVLFWLNVFYSYLLLTAGSGVMVMELFQSQSLYRSQAITVIVSVLTPLFGNALYIFRLLPKGLDLTPFFFLPSALALTWAITRYRLLDVIPPAQSVILQNLRDGVILLDKSHRVIFMNQTAAEIFHRDINASLGQPMEFVCADCSESLLSMLASHETSLEIALDASHEVHYFDVNIAPLVSAASDTVSHLLVFENITQRKQAEADLKRRDAILRSVSLAAEEFLKASSWEKNIQTVLEQMGQAAGVSRVYIFEHMLSESGQQIVKQTYEWAAPDISPQIQNAALQNFAWREEGFERWASELEQDHIISGPVNEFPASEQAILQAQGIQSLAVIPIFMEKTFWGFIGFDDCLTARQWSPSELDALRAAADIFGAALERRKSELRLIRRQHSQNLLQEIIRAALGKNEVSEMAQFLVDHLGSLIGADHCFLSGWDETHGRPIPIAAYGVPLEDYLHLEFLPDEKNITASALETGHLLIIDDIQNSPYVSQRAAAIFNTRSMLAIPMISNQKWLGAVMLGFGKLHKFTPDEIIISEQAVELITLAFAKMHAVKESERRAEESETLRRAGATVAETLDLSEATTRLLEQLAYVLPHDSASVQLLRDGELEIIAGEGWSNPADIIGLRFPIPGNNPNSIVIETGRPILLNDASQQYPSFRQPPHDHIKSWLGVPLMVRDRPIGLLAIDSKKTRHFTPDDITLVNVFASQVAVAIENARLFNETQQRAITDGLTGLYNHRHFMELAKSEFERSRRYKRSLSAMMLDVDHFKRVNDNYGHLFGDTVLQSIAKLCNEKLRETDIIGRYGGEEFSVLLVETDLATAQKIAERMRQGVAALAFSHKDAEVHVTISVGVAEANEATPTLEALIARADQALYVAKHKGRNRVAVGK